MTLTLSGASSGRAPSASDIANATRPSLTAYSASNPLYVPHRNAPLRYPEETIVGMDAIIAAGFPCLENDIYTLTDGGLGAMHDTTVNRVTTSTGNVEALTTAQFKDLVLPTDTFLGAGYGNQNPPLFGEIIARYTGKAILFPEAKGLGSGAPMLTVVNAYKVPKDQLVVQSFFPGELTGFVAAGYQVLQLMNNGTEQTAAGLRSAGVNWVGMDYTQASDATVAGWVAAGFKVMLYTVDRRFLRDKYLTMGVTGFFTDDPEYLSTNSPLSNVDAFSAQKWPRGMIDMTTGYSGGQTFRGKFSTPNYWGWDLAGTAAFCLQGWAGPIKNNVAVNTFSIYFDLTFDAANGGDTTRWAALWLSDKRMVDDFYDDSGNANAFGYNILLRKSGILQIFRRDAGVNAGAIAASSTSTTIADGAEVRFRLDVTPTSITLNRLNADGTVNYNVTTNDTNYRGGYFHFGKNGLGCRFRNVRVV